MPLLEPCYDCALCPRLSAFLIENRQKFPSFFNGPVPSFGAIDAALLIVGLAPGLKGANQTGRPFTGDYAGDLLYSTLLKYGFAKGVFKAHKDDGLTLNNCRITNAVRCVPPQNKPLPLEIATCNGFLKSQFDHMPHLKVVVSLGLVAHQSILKALKLKVKDYPFAHGAVHKLDSFVLMNSYHCSKYNTQTKRLTESMFHDVFEKVLKNV